MRAAARGLAGLAAWVGLGWAALGLLACAPGSPPRPGAAEAGPLLWRAEAPRSGAVFHLFGSVHLGDLRMLDLGEPIRSAYATSDELVVEVDFSAQPPDRMAALIARHTRLQPPTTLRDVLSEETWRALEDYCLDRGLESGAFLGLKPWFVSVTIVQLELAGAGFQAELGVDYLFIQEAKGEKPIVALETPASQLRALDATSPAVQERVLADTLARADELVGDTEKMIGAWRRGDEDELEAQVFGALDEIPELEAFYERVFFQRNREMTDRLIALGGDGRPRFVVLGAGHMVGDEGIPTLLGRSGWRVSRVGR
jgi:uncharacterized protein YbaP (TraB family)